jgi:hypothetical protein
MPIDKEEVKMSIDPKISMWLNIAVSVLGFLTGASAQLTDIFGQGETQKIVALCGLAVGLLGSINTALHGASSAQAGPMNGEKSA